MIADFCPDWRQFWTPLEIQTELGIEFKGPGWYNLFATDTALITPTNDQQWDDKYDEKDKFFVYVWNRPNAQLSFEQIVHAPTRS